MSADHPCNELGRRLMAALISYHLGLGLEYTLKRYVPRQAPSLWCNVAHDLLTELVQNHQRQVADLAAAATRQLPAAGPKR